MTGTLQFSLPEDREDFAAAMHAGQLVDIITTLDNWLRSKTKYADGTDEPAATAAYEKARDELWQIIRDSGASEVLP